VSDKVKSVINRLGHYCSYRKTRERKFRAGKLKTPDGGRVFGLVVLLTLAFSLSLTDVVYASPGPYVTGCRWLFQAGLWGIIALVSWVDAGSLLPIIVDLYKVIGGARVGRIQDSVSGTGSKEYTFSNIPGQADDRFLVDVQFFDANKNDWVHTPDKVGTMECPRPESQTVTQITTLTSSTTLASSATIIQEKTITAEVQMPLSFGQQYWPYLMLLVALVTLTLGYGLSASTKYFSSIYTKPRPPSLCGTACTCGGGECNSPKGTHCSAPGCKGGCTGTCDVVNPNGQRHEGPHHCSHGHQMH